jgi:hypothetical protein
MNWSIPSIRNSALQWRINKKSRNQSSLAAAFISEENDN